jgi:hypothetical protein
MTITPLMCMWVHHEDELGARPVGGTRDLVQDEAAGRQIRLHLPARSEAQRRVRVQHRAVGFEREGPTEADQLALLAGELDPVGDRADAVQLRHPQGVGALPPLPRPGLRITGLEHQVPTWT